MAGTTVWQRVQDLNADYATMPIWRLFNEDRIPVERFPVFFRELYMGTRWFQDFIWASTDIPSGPYAAFAAEHRRVDSGHWRWMKHDVASFGLQPLTEDDFFGQDFLPTRIQLARVLGAFHGASPEARMVILLSLEAAGEVTLGTIWKYAARKGLQQKAIYFGDQHMRIEDKQTMAIHDVAGPVMESTDPRLVGLAELIFDVMHQIFTRSTKTYYADLAAQIQ